MSGQRKRVRPRRQCGSCGRITQARDFCLPCRQELTPTVRPVRPCANCGRRTTTLSGYCSPCAPEAARLTEDDLLLDGRWVQRGLIQVWEPAADMAPRPVDLGPSAPWVHGTERGYQRHRRHRDNWPLPDDDPCGCKAAHAAHEAFRVEMQRRESEVA